MYLRYSTVQWFSNFYELLDSLPGEWYRNLAVSLNHESLTLWPDVQANPLHLQLSEPTSLANHFANHATDLARSAIAHLADLFDVFVSRRPNPPRDLAIIHCLRSCFMRDLKRRKPCSVRPYSGIWLWRCRNCHMSLIWHSMQSHAICRQLPDLGYYTMDTIRYPGTICRRCTNSETEPKYCSSSVILT